MGECPLAQSIVVGLLRSLLTICNSQMHNKFAGEKKGGGADSYREWQITYQFVMADQLASMNSKGAHSSRYMEMLKPCDRVQLAAYEEYNRNPSADSGCHSEFYSHKIYTTSAIAVFFCLLLLSLKQNSTHIITQTSSSTPTSSSSFLTPTAS